MARARRWLLLLAGTFALPGLALAQDFAARGFELGPTSPREASPADVRVFLQRSGGPGEIVAEGDARATPWNSSMPIWQDFLSEEEIWQVIAFIYDASGSTPRTWGEEH